MSGAGQRIAAIVALVAASVAAGVIPGALSPLGTLALAACGLMVLSIVMLRSALARGSGDSTTRVDSEQPYEEPTIEVPELRLARILFYGGCLLVCESALRYAAGLTLGELMFLGAFALCVLAMARGQAPVGIPPALVIAVAIFVFGAAISSFDAQSQSGSAFQTVHAVYVLLLWPVVGALVLRTRRQVAIAVALWSVSAAVASLGAIAQLLGAHLPGVAQEGSRMTGFTEHPNDLGAATAIALVPALLLATRPAVGEGSLVRILRWLPVALIAVGLALSGSVSAMAAAAVAVLVWLSSPSVRAPARVAVAGAIVCALAVVAVAGGRVTSPVQRLSEVANPGAQSGGSVQDRLSIVQQAWPRISSDPLVGVGLDTPDSAVTIVSHGYTVPYQLHGLPLAAWYQTGIFGVVGILGLLGVLAVVGWGGVAASATEQDALTGFALLAALIAWVIASMTQPMVFQQYGWISAVFVVAWWVHIRATSARAGVETQPNSRESSREPAQTLVAA